MAERKVYLKYFGQVWAKWEGISNKVHIRSPKACYCEIELIIAQFVVPHVHSVLVYWVFVIGSGILKWGYISALIGLRCCQNTSPRKTYKGRRQRGENNDAYRRHPQGFVFVFRPGERIISAASEQLHRRPTVRPFRFSGPPKVKAVFIITVFVSGSCWACSRTEINRVGLEMLMEERARAQSAALGGDGAFSHAE